MTSRSDDPLTTAREPRCVGVVLAAGASSRMGAPKAALTLAGRTFLAHVVAALEGGGVPEVVVVIGDDPDGAVAGAARACSVGLVRNPAPERGQLASLKVALEHVVRTAPEAEAVLVALVDHPAVRASTVAALREAAAREPEAAIFVAAHDGRRGHPVLFRRSVWPELLAAPDEGGARTVVRAEPARVRVVPVDDPGVVTDVDTPEDLRRLRAAVEQERA